MASLIPAELHEATKRSGRLGGRPRKPTVAEAREAASEELMPAANSLAQGAPGRR
jgi:hypothetical protein